MASINRLKRELLFKIVFYGPGLGGKTTTLQHLHAATKPENRGNMVSLATDTDRTLYFDFLPVKLLRVGDVTVKLQLYTVPGQVYYAATRKLVLSGADGIVFVADTQGGRLDSNLESLDDLNANLAEQGRKLSALPHAFQWNKRDLPELIPLDELDRRLNLFGAPSRPTVATTGHGVFDVLEDITRLVVEAYRAELPITGGRADGIPLFLDAEEVGLSGAIQDLADSQPIRSSPTARVGLIGTPGRSPRAPEKEKERDKDSKDKAARSERGVGARAAERAVERAPEREPRGRSSPVQASVAAFSIEPATGKLAAPVSAFSLVELWPPADQDVARRAEQALGAGDVVGAIAACEDLLSRVLAAASLFLGRQAHPDPALVVTLLGLDGTRYLAFRAVVRSVRAKRAPTLRHALECYAFAIEARRRLDRAR